MAQTKITDIISNSSRISGGCPKCYLVKTERKQTEFLTKITFGKKDLQEENRTVLLVGEKGVGKSSLINALFNNVVGVEFKDEVWFKITEKDSDSQVSGVIVYEIFGLKDEDFPYSLTIIDTPGYIRSRDLKQDIMICQRIQDFIKSEDGIKEVHAMGFVVKASESRLNDRLKDSFHLLSLFDLRIVALVTFSNGRTPKNVLQALEASDLQCFKNDKNETVHFLFDNCQSEDRIGDITDLQHAYKRSMIGTKQIINFLKQVAPQSLQKTEIKFTRYFQMAAKVKDLEDKIQGIEKQQELKQKKDLGKKEGEMEDHRDSTVIVPDTELVKKKYCCFQTNVVRCQTCKHNCHDICKCDSSPENCSVMISNACTICPSNCPASDHVKDKFRYVENTDNTGNLEDSDEEIQKLEAQKANLLEELNEHRDILKQYIASKTTPRLERTSSSNDTDSARPLLEKAANIH